MKIILLILSLIIYISLSAQIEYKPIKFKYITDKTINPFKEITDTINACLKRLDKGYLYKQNNQYFYSPIFYDYYPIYNNTVILNQCYNHWNTSSVYQPYYYQPYNTQIFYIYP